MADAPNTDGGDLARLIEALGDPRAYRHPVEAVEVRQTHISAVFLAGPFAYKVKKPVDLAFVDYRTLDRRRHFCEEEVRLNRRLAPEVYLGVVPVARDPNDGRLVVEGTGAVVEWAVKMERLPGGWTLAARLARGGVGDDEVVALARRVAGFHDSADAGPDVAASGRFPVVSRNALENFEQAERAGQVGSVVSPAVFDRLRGLTVAALGRLHGLIEARADRGIPRDTHGDLRLGHVYVRPDRPPPHDVAIIDCVEFHERFRHADPVADAAFPVMELTAAGRRDLARVFADAYFAASGDDEGRALLPFYTAYRAAVRAKVEGMTAAEPEVPRADRDAAQARARALWQLALGELEERSRRPCLVLIGGLPGAGKSTLARDLAARAGFRVARSDVVRKELAGGPVEVEDLYTPEWDDRTYDECLRRSEGLVVEGGRVIVDASFRADARRRAFLGAADRWGVPGLLLHCRADPETTRRRLADRAGTGDASDADWPVYLEAVAKWEEPGPEVSPRCVVIDTTGERDTALGRALDALRGAGLFDG
jgi:aminoglycoside phosphotransferase family enzyme/predicted kinase